MLSLCFYCGLIHGIYVAKYSKVFSLAKDMSDIQSVSYSREPLSLVQSSICNPIFVLPVRFEPTARICLNQK